MRKNTVAAILAILCILLVGNSIFNFFIPSETDETILEGNHGIVENLKIAFHTHYMERSENQSVAITLSCSEGSLDLVILESTEFMSWYNGSEYTALYEFTNTSFVDGVFQIDPTYKGFIDIGMSTPYGDVTFWGNIHSRSIVYNDIIAIISLAAAFALIVFIIDLNKKPQRVNEPEAAGLAIS